MFSFSLSRALSLLLNAQACTLFSMHCDAVCPCPCYAVLCSSNRRIVWVRKHLSRLRNAMHGSATFQTLPSNTGGPDFFADLDERLSPELNFKQDRYFQTIQKRLTVCTCAYVCTMVCLMQCRHCNVRGIRNQEKDGIQELTTHTRGSFCSMPIT